MCVGNFMCAMLRLLWFNLCNGFLGIAAFGCVVIGCALSIALLPLCCLGLLVFRLLILVVSGFALLDVRLHNWISPHSRHVFVDQNGVFSRDSDSRLARDVANCSPQALATVLYFGTVKLVISSLSLVSVAMAIPTPSVAMSGTDPVVDIGATLVVMVVGMALMHLVAKLSTAITRFVCCEQLAIYQYVPLAQPVYAPHYTLCIDRD